MCSFENVDWLQSEPAVTSGLNAVTTLGDHLSAVGHIFLEPALWSHSWQLGKGGMFSPPNSPADILRDLAGCVADSAWRGMLPVGSLAVRREVLRSRKIRLPACGCNAGNANDHFSLFWNQCYHVYLRRCEHFSES